MKIFKKWIFHSVAQNIINLFPKSLSIKIYSIVQKKFGRGSNIDYIFKLKRSLQLFSYIKKNKFNYKTVLELGTGRTITTLIGLKILGVKKIFTIDLNPYLSEHLTKKIIYQIVDNKDKLFFLFKDYLPKNEFIEKINLLSKIKDYPINLILKELNINYYSEQDAKKLELIKSKTVDVYFSDQVLEHIPLQSLKDILDEGKRVLSQRGALISTIGLHDHFYAIDKTISKINFLKFNKLSWHILAGNKFMYHNRLRSSDFIKLFMDNGFKIIDKEEEIDQKSLSQLKDGFKLNKNYKKYSKEDLSVTKLVLVCSVIKN